MIYGEFKVRVEEDVTDRIGIRTLVLSKYWQAEPGRTSIDELDVQKPSVPGVPGGMIFIGAETRPYRGGLKTFWTFEGINGDGKSPTFKDRTHSIDYGFKPGFAEADIRLHPQIQTLLETYGGYADPESGHILWPATIDSGGGASGLSSSSASSGTTNPMFGIQSFFRIEGVYRFRYAAFSLPKFDNVSKAVDTAALPGGPPNYTNRDWLKLSPAYERRGPVYEILEEYWLSGEGRWPKPVYRG